jgi:predicted phosphodiesterase
MVHGSPWDPLQGYIYPDADLSPFRALPYDFVFMGNTHRPFIKKLGKITVVNVGSCGLPRDRGDLASCAVFDAGSGRCSVHRIAFDPSAVLAQQPSFLHRSVRDCFSRRPEVTVFGAIVRGQDR